MVNLFKYWVQGFAVVAVYVYSLLYIPMPHLKNMRFESYEVAPIRKLSGPLSLNTRLNNVEKLFEHLITGPETIVHLDGVLYTGLHGGWLVKLTNDTLIPFVKFGKGCDGPQAEYCARPLGLFLDSTKSLYVCDAYNGVFKVNIQTGETDQLVSADTWIGGKKSNYFNSVTVASNGNVYYTITDSNFDMKNTMFSFLGDGSGRLVKYDPVTRENTILMDKLYMANGVALALDESYVVVVEMKKNALTRFFLNGNKKDNSEVFIDGLPGVPDNVKADGRGNFYVSLIISKNRNFFSTYMDMMSQYPLLRKLIAQTLAMVQTGCEYAYNVFPTVVLKKTSLAIGQYETFMDFLPSVTRGTVVKIDKDGNIIDSLHSIDGRISAISDIEFVGDYAYLGSPFNKFLARVRLNKQQGSD